MKKLLSESRVVLLTLLTITHATLSLATIVTFDDIPTGLQTFTMGDGTVFTIVPHVALTNGYQELNWLNLSAVNAPLLTSRFGPNGDLFGMVSISNVVGNSDGAPSEISSPNTNFNFLSTYLTGRWNSNLNIQVQGFKGGSLLYDQIVVASATSSTLYTFNYLNIDQLRFTPFGGQNAGFPSGGSGAYLAMDNFSFEFVPEPSAFLLTTAGALLLIAGFKRKPPK
jgi:hypothetical protein